MKDIYKIMEKYQPTEDIFTEEEEVEALKKIIFEDLDEVERRIFLIYTENMSLRKTAKEVGVSPTAIWLKVKEIRKKILEIYDNNRPDDN